MGSIPLGESNTIARHNWQMCLKINTWANPNHVRKLGEMNKRVPHQWTSQDNLAKYRECRVRWMRMVYQSCHTFVTLEYTPKPKTVVSPAQAVYSIIKSIECRLLVKLRHLASYSASIICRNRRECPSSFTTKTTYNYFAW